MSQLRNRTMGARTICGTGLSFVCAAFLFMSISALAAPAQSNATETTPAQPGAAVSASSKKKKSTELNFDDVLVYGKYHFSDEAVTTVEEDKVLDALLGVRTDFRDRMKKSASRH